MNISSIWFFILTLISSQLFAHSGGVGNGGDVVVCPDSVTLLDTYEAGKLGLTLDLNPNQMNSPSWRSMVEVAVDRLSKKDKYTAKKVYEYAMEMVTDLENFRTFPSASEQYRGRVLYLGPDNVGEISDSAHRTIPVGCEIRQLVSQIVPQRIRDNRYEMNKKLWDRLSLLDQTMTILHEAWYRILLEDGAKDSRGARYMNALVASVDFDDDNFSDYLKDLQSTEKKYYVIENNSSLIFDPLFKVDLKNASLQFDGERVCTKSLDVKANIKKVAPITTLHMGLAKIEFTNVCFNNSVMESLTLPKKFSGKRLNFVMENYLVRTHGNLAEAGVIKFNPNGSLRTIENLEFEALYKMYYVCGRGRNAIVTFDKATGCKGPYLHDESMIKNPASIIFNEKEVPMDFNFPSSL
jgi:hypothetical protein